MTLLDTEPYLMNTEMKMNVNMDMNMNDPNLVISHSKALEENEGRLQNVSASSIRALHCSADYLSVFGTLCDKSSNSKWYVSMKISALLNDPSVLIEGVLFRARYLGSTQLVCEGQPTKSTRMCQAEEAVSRIKVFSSLPSSSNV